MPQDTVSGGCLCGAVKFEIDLPTKWCANCHCSMCRRAHGAAYVTWVGVDADRFRVVAGDDQLARHHSSDDAWRSFCRTCGSTLLFESTRWAGEVHITRSSIEGEIDRDIQVHAFFDDRAVWHSEPADGLPRLGGKTGTEPLD